MLVVFITYFNNVSYCKILNIIMYCTIMVIILKQYVMWNCGLYLFMDTNAGRYICSILKILSIYNCY